jgi:hypothetical protein
MKINVTSYVSEGMYRRVSSHLPQLFVWWRCNAGGTVLGSRHLKMKTADLDVILHYKLNTSLWGHELEMGER